MNKTVANCEESILTVHVMMSSLRSPPPPPRPLGATVGAETHTQCIRQQRHCKNYYSRAWLDFQD